MCKCCYTTTGGMRQYTADFEPVAPHSFDDLWEKKLTSVLQVKGETAFLIDAAFRIDLHRANSALLITVT
jgi:hypothetical protein